MGEEKEKFEPENREGWAPDVEGHKFATDEEESEDEDVEAHGNVPGAKPTITPT